MFAKLMNQQYGFGDRIGTYKSIRDDKVMIQRMKKLKELDVHNGCVNTICWSDTGQYILSGSDDVHLCITNTITFKKKALIRTGHKSNIFSAKFLPCTNERQLISCSGDGAIYYTNLDSPFVVENTNKFTCHFGTTYELRVIPNDPFTFLSCGEDATVRFFDLRCKTGCGKEDCKEDILINCQRAVTSMSVDPSIPYYLAVGCSDSSIRIYDRRMLGTPTFGFSIKEPTQGLVNCSKIPTKQDRVHRITSLVYNSNGSELLASYSAENIYLYKLKEDKYIKYSTKESKTSKTWEGHNQFRAASLKPPKKRLRVRGDWSDTGPNARPESESASRPVQPRGRRNLIERMGDVLSRMFNEPSRRNLRPRSGNQSQQNVDAEIDEESHPTPVVEEPRPSTSSVSDAQNTSLPSTSKEKPVENFKSIETNLRSMRKDFIDKNKMEPVVNIHYDSQGPSSGVLSMGVADTHEREHVSIENQNEETEEEVTQSKPGDDCEIESNTTVETEPEHETPDSDSSIDNTPLVNRDEEEAEDEPAIDDGLLVNLRQRIVDCTREDAEAPESYSSDEISGKSADEIEEERMNRMESLPHYIPYRSYCGHRNARTMIKEANFWGDRFIVSGSDCGHVFFWDKETAEVVTLLEADRHVVNCVQPHPFDPILASSGIDYDVKLWAPIGEEPFHDSQKSTEIMRRNRIMLEESLDTVTVPASFMIRLLASLSSPRRPGASSDSTNAPAP